MSEVTIRDADLQNLVDIATINPTQENWAAVAKYAQTQRTEALKVEKAAYEEKSAERIAIVERLRKDFGEVLEGYMDEIVAATGGNYHVRYVLTPKDFNISIMDLPKTGKTAGTTITPGKKYSVSTKDLLAKFPEYQDEYDIADEKDKEKGGGNFAYAVRKKLIKADKGE